jgi:hypothetical protein
MSHAGELWSAAAINKANIYKPPKESILSTDDALTDHCLIALTHD